MKYFKLFLIVSIFIHINCKAQDFSIGLANLGTRFIPDKGNYDHANHDFISPGFELQLSYRLLDKLVITSGVNYQSLFFKTPIENETYPPARIYSLLIRDISIPLLLRYNFAEIGSSYHLGFTSGLYFAIPLHALETIDDKIYGGGGYRASEISFYIPAKYSFIYVGFGGFKTISPKFEIYAEPFGSYQLKKSINQSLDTQEFRNRFWYGIKIGINYSFKIWRNED
jgi:hypothetical protein